MWTLRVHPPLVLTLQWSLYLTLKIGKTSPGSIRIKTWQLLSFTPLKFLNSFRQFSYNCEPLKMRSRHFDYTNTASLTYFSSLNNTYRMHVNPGLPWKRGKTQSLSGINDRHALPLWSNITHPHLGFVQIGEIYFTVVGAKSPIPPDPPYTPLHTRPGADNPLSALP